MGCNYYIRPNKCETCGRTDEHIHIGKSSVGWQFCFSALERKTPPEWFEFQREHKDDIFDEYGRTVTLYDLVQMIDSKKNGVNAENYYDRMPTERRTSYDVNNKEYVVDGIRFYDGEFS